MEYDLLDIVLDFQSPVPVADLQDYDDQDSEDDSDSDGGEGYERRIKVKPEPDRPAIVRFKYTRTMDMLTRFYDILYNLTNLVELELDIWEYSQEVKTNDMNLERLLECTPNLDICPYLAATTNLIDTSNEEFYRLFQRLGNLTSIHIKGYPAYTNGFLQSYTRGGESSQDDTMAAESHTWYPSSSQPPAIPARQRCISSLDLQLFLENSPFLKYFSAGSRMIQVHDMVQLSDKTELSAIYQYNWPQLFPLREAKPWACVGTLEHLSLGFRVASGIRSDHQIAFRQLSRLLKLKTLILKRTNLIPLPGYGIELLGGSDDGPEQQGGLSKSLRLLAFGQTQWVVDQPETFACLFERLQGLERFHMDQVPPPDVLQEFYERTCTMASFKNNHQQSIEDDEDGWQVVSSSSSFSLSKEHKDKHATIQEQEQPQEQESQDQEVPVLATIPSSNSTSSLISSESQQSDNLIEKIPKKKKKQIFGTDEFQPVVSKKQMARASKVQQAQKGRPNASTGVSTSSYFDLLQDTEDAEDVNEILVRAREKEAEEEKLRQEQEEAEEEEDQATQEILAAKEREQEEEERRRKEEAKHALALQLEQEKKEEEEALAIRQAQAAASAAAAAEQKEREAADAIAAATAAASKKQKKEEKAKKDKENQQREALAAAQLLAEQEQERIRAEEAAEKDRKTKEALKSVVPEATEKVEAEDQWQVESLGDDEELDDEWQEQSKSKKSRKTRSSQQTSSAAVEIHSKMPIYLLQDETPAQENEDEEDDQSDASQEEERLLRAAAAAKAAQKTSFGKKNKKKSGSNPGSAANSPRMEGKKSKKTTVAVSAPAPKVVSEPEEVHAQSPAVAEPTTPKLSKRKAKKAAVSDESKEPNVDVASTTTEQESAKELASSGMVQKDGPTDMMGGMVSSIFEKGVNPGLIKLLNVVFVALFLSLGFLIFASEGNVHVIALTGIAVALFLAVQWFLREMETMRVDERKTA
ncbi:hypothetical protein EMPS_06465 [Entomortierella parvispora]|uniref:Uncharacterized protein n=1 Tax=Entomortierella parvispora TaxID=205924 RepID=A0A9P3LXG9_9FUNG|nr:hypothetical protein EMPS_06465 [Entomortierella parvispora]